MYLSADCPSVFDLHFFRLLRRAPCASWTGLLSVLTKSINSSESERFERTTGLCGGDAGRIVSACARAGKRGQFRS